MHEAVVDESNVAPGAMASPRRPTVSHRRLSAYLLGYAMGPVSLVFILVLRQYGWVADVPVWGWLAVFLAIPIASLLADVAYRSHPADGFLHVRIATHAAAVTIVIALSGWGPVLTGAFVFVALENLAHDGSRTWRITMLWSLIGIALCQLGISLSIFPSYLSDSHGAALSLMGAFVLVFVVRMAGVAWEQKEEAEASMRASEDRFRSLVQHAADTTIVMSEQGVVTYASPAAVALAGRPLDAIVGQPALDLVHPDDRELVSLQIAAQLTEDAGVGTVEFRLADGTGGWRVGEATVSDLRGRPSVGGFVANVRDITDRKEAEELLAHQAVHDPLTGLANRTLILDRAQQMLCRAERMQLPIAAMFVDLDNFKEVNDTLGHEAGDELLRSVADRFRTTVRASDTVGRLGGDEFVVLAEGLSLAAGPETLAERFQEVLREPFVIERAASPLLITASIGVAVGRREQAEELLRDADIALYRAKASGKDCFALFEPEMQSAVLQRRGLKIDLQSALANNEFHLLYQPLFDLQTMEVYGVEALLRWEHPERGLIGPNDFVPLLEETGLIVEVGRWVLDEACRQVAAWRRSGFDLTISVNVSMRQLDTPALVDHVRGALAANDLEGSALLVEITETALMRDAESTGRRLIALRALGVGIAIDDFGTGYSSLAYLRQFAVDALKIDRSFIAEMTQSRESEVLIQAMVGLAHALGLSTLAEGIEETGQLERLRAQGCQRGQGFLVSRPVPAERIVELLAAAPAIAAGTADER